MDTDELKKLFMNELKKFRSQAEFSRKSGLSQPYIHAIVHGGRPPGQKVARYFNLVRKVEWVPQEETATHAHNANITRDLHDAQRNA